MPISFPWCICKRPVATTHYAIRCDICNLWCHIKCNFVSNKQYAELEDDEKSWSCIQCFKKALPFSDVHDEVTKLTRQGKNIDISCFPEPNSQNINLFHTLQNKALRI